MSRKSPVIEVLERDLLEAQARREQAIRDVLLIEGQIKRFSEILKKRRGKPKVLRPGDPEPQAKEGAA